MSENRRTDTAGTEPNPENEYQLIYWPGIPGRGEPIRLLFEEAGVRYNDVALSPNGLDVTLEHISENFECVGTIPPFAPPILRHGDVLLYQSPNILLYLAEKLKLVPSNDSKARFQAHELVLTALDLQNEAHDTHHPIAPMEYYDDQKTEALRRAKDFRANRVPKFLSYFNRVLERSPGTYLLSEFTYADLVLFQVLDGLQFAFPKCMKQELGKAGNVKALYEVVKARDNVKAYLESGRRCEYGDGVYRRYEELDG